MEILPCGSAASLNSVIVDPADLRDLPLSPAQYQKVISYGTFEEEVDALLEEERRAQRESRKSKKRAFHRMKILYGNRCAYCGFPGGSTRDHVIPKCLGGPDDLGNILPACRPCNAEKGGLPLAVWRYKVLREVERRGLGKVPKRWIGIVERSKACFAPFPMTPRQRRRLMEERVLEMQRRQSDNEYVPPQVGAFATL